MPTARLRGPWVALAFGGALFLSALFSSVGCQNFHVIDSGRVYRTAQPDASTLEAMIQEHGI